jgi:hypothetical protein
MRIRIAMAALVVSLAAGSLHADLQRALSEQDLGKRSKMALENAALALDAARKAYQNGDLDIVATDAKEIEDSVNLAFMALQQTGKDPRKSPKWFKSAEIATRDLSRRLDTFQRDMSFADRPILDQVIARVQQVHDTLLMGLMEGRRK